MKALSLFFNKLVDIQDLPRIKPKVRYEGVVVISKLDFYNKKLKGTVVTDLSLTDWCFFNAYTLIKEGQGTLFAKLDEQTNLAPIV